MFEGLSQGFMREPDGSMSVSVCSSGQMMREGLGIGADQNHL